MATCTVTASLLSQQNSAKTPHFSLATPPHFFPTLKSHFSPKASLRTCSFCTQAVAFRIPSVVCCSSSSSVASTTKNYEFCDAASEVELRVHLEEQHIQSHRDIIVDADDFSLTIALRHSGSTVTLMKTSHTFERIKPSETIWFIDDDQLVVNLKKKDPEIKWPDIMESWESLTAGSLQFLKGTSIYIVGDSTEINQKVARELAVGLGYTPLDTKELLELYSKKSIESWVQADGSDSVAEAERVVLESLSSHVRSVIATLGGWQGAARRSDMWRHLYAGFTVWLSQTKAVDEESAKEEATRNKLDGCLAYSNADVIVKLQGWDADHAKSVAQASLSALKQLVVSDKELPGKKNLYVRLGCRGDWPNIKPPGWDPSTGSDAPAASLHQ